MLFAPMNIYSPLTLQLPANAHSMPPPRYEHAARSLDETGRLIGGWTKTQTTSSSKTIASADATTA